MKIAARGPIAGLFLLLIALAVIKLTHTEHKLPPKEQATEAQKITQASDNRAPVADEPHQSERAEPEVKNTGAAGRAIAADKAASTVDRSIGILLSKGFKAPDSAVVSADVDPVINQVLSESWLDPENKAVRRRIRVVDSKFKYSKLRLEEEVTWNASRSRLESKVRRASVADHMMVKPASGQDRLTVIGKLTGQGFKLREESDGLLLVEIPDSTSPTAQLEASDKLEALQKFVDFAEPDYLVFPCVVPNDPLYSQGQQWALENTTSNTESRADADIDAEGAWSIRTSAANITVAVLDTGVRYTHEDLANRIWHDTSGNPGWDAYDNDNDPMDINGHGTHCAGIIGAQGNNGLGISGVAWDVKIMPIRFIGPFGGTTSDAIRSINYARENGADIISASWGGSGYSRGLRAAIEACYAADIPVVTAAGNERWDVDAKPQYPASYPTPNIVSVAATTRTDELTTFSNYGYTAVDLAAPGENILSCGIASDSDYQYLSGTSAATPYVAGALALAKAQFGQEPVDALVLRLLRSVDRVDALQGKVAMEGRLNLRQLLLSASTGYAHDFFNSPYIFRWSKGYWGALNRGLTREPDEDSYSPDTGQRSAWFQWTAIGDGLLRFTGSVDRPYLLDAGQDVSVVAFEGTIRNQLRRIKDNFTMRPTNSSELSFYVKKDKTYTFSVDSRSSIDQIVWASFSFSPGNDMFSQATQILPGTSFSVEGTNAAATIEPFEELMPHQNLVQQASVWWKWTPTQTGEYVISTFGSNFDTVLGVYARGGGTFQTIGFNDSRSLTDDTSRLEVTLTAGQEYYIAVASYNKDTVGNIRLAGFPKKQIRFLQQPASQLVRLGDRFELAVVTDSVGETTYQWYGPQGPLDGVGNQSRITIPAASASDMGNYYVVAKNGESSGQSATATITELALAPRFVFSPQDISVPTGTDIQMFARADGLQPVTLRWFKAGVQIQTGSIHTLPNPTPADSGIYYVEASNSVGTTRSLPFQVLVSTDTFGPMVYRSPGLPSGLTGTKYINGRHMAFGMDGRLMLSTNGINWDTPPLSKPIDINDIAYEASLGRYVMVAYDHSLAAAASAVSLDGRNWTLNPTPLPGGSVLDKVVAGNGVFIGYPTSQANKVYTTTNGLDWTARDYTTAGTETSKYLQNIVFYNGQFIGGGRGMIYRSTDGITWTSNTTPNDGRILVHNNQLVTFTGSPVSFSTSTDGITWSTPVPCVGAPADLTKITTNGTRFYQVVGSTVSSSADGINWTTLTYDFKPTTTTASGALLSMFSGPEGNLVAVGLTCVVQGPSFTQLASSSTQTIIDLPPITKIFGNTIYQLDDTATSVVYSNDMRTWQKNDISTRYSFEGDSLIYAKGKYWAFATSYSTGQRLLYSGNSPMTLSANGEGTNITSITYLRSWNDEVYGCASDKVYKLDANSNWQAVFTITTGDTIRGMKTISRGIMIWASSGAVYATTNGTTWTRVTYNGGTNVVADVDHPSLKPRYTGPSLCEFNSKAYLYVSSINKLYVATTGFNFSSQQNLNPFSRLTSVPQGLLGIEGNIGWYSADGTTWQQFNLPYLTDFFFHYNGTLFVWSQKGIYQAGIPTSAAPENSVENMVKYQSVLSGSRVNLSYSAVDRENRFDHAEFYLNGVLLGQSTNATGFQSVDVNWAGERVVEMRSFDQDGKMSTDFWSIGGITSQPDKVVDTTVTSASTYGVTVWNNRLQVGMGQKLYSKIGNTWFGRDMPFSTIATKYLTTPNAIFAIGSGLKTARNYLMSTDGLSWRDMNLAADDMVYQDGWFIAKNLGISRDGISWITASGNLGTAAGNGSIVTLTGNGISASTVKVSNDGSSWATYTGINIKTLYVDSGYFMGTSDQTFLRSTDARTWTNLSPALDPGEVIQNLDIAGGWYYLITKNFNTWYLWISQDKGATWTKMTSPPPKANQIAYGNGIWLAVTPTGIYSSADGLNWVTSISQTQITSGAIPAPTTRGAAFLAHEDGVSIKLNNGIWTTQDGLTWSQTALPTSELSPPMLSEALTIDGTTQLTILSSKVLVSKSGTDWKQCPLTLTGGKFPRYATVASGKILVYAGVSNGNLDLWQSTDGVNFTQVALTGNYSFTAFKYENGRYFAKGTIDGVTFNKFLSSTDGVNWTTLTTPADFSSTIELLNSTLIIVDSFNQKIYTSADGVTWQSTSLRLDSLTYGNGKFLAGRDSSVLSGTTIANLAVVTSDTSPYGGKLAFANGVFYLKTSSGIWKSTTGQTWQQLYTSLNGNLEVIANTIYVKDTTNLVPLFAADLQVTGIVATPSNLAVGANMSATISLKNIGTVAIPAGTKVRIRAALTRDSLVGNEDDVFAGSYDAVLTGGLAIGASTNLSVTYKVPGLKAGGGFKLVLVADPETPELTRANNHAVTASAVVTVDEFVLNIVRNGDGSVGRDVSNVRYANGTLVTLSANAAKGSAFGGWSGSTVSPLSQLTLMMNQNQNLTANFLNTATLQLSVKGQGTVNGWTDPGSYIVGSTASLTAQPDTGWEFARWAGGSTSTNAAISLTVTQNTNLTAIFRQTPAGWRNVNFTPAEQADPAISGDFADADGDGIPNWQEYLHGSDPKNPRAKGIIQQGVDGGFLQIIYTRNAGIEAPYAIICEGSRDLVHWDAVDLEQRILSSSNGQETIEARMPATASGSSKAFMRIRYVQP